MLVSVWMYKVPCSFGQHFKKSFRAEFFINPFLANVPILYPLKTPENQRFSGVFKGFKMGTFARNALKLEDNESENKRFVIQEFLGKIISEI